MITAVPENNTSQQSVHAAAASGVSAATTELTEVHGLLSSDNVAGIHPAVMAAIQDANVGHALAYGDDPWTTRATRRVHEHFGADVEVVFSFGGTGGNMVALASVLESFESVICPDSSHLWMDEGGAPQRWLGSKISPVATFDGKLRPADIAPFLADRGVVHRAQPRVVSISQPTEWGTVYTVDELQALSEFCHGNDLYLHIDGARFANAAASLGVPLRAISTDCGIDVLTLGGSKNGLFAAEAVIAFGAVRHCGLRYRLKQCGQLASKMRFIAAQFEAVLSNELWLTNARHANAMARELAAMLKATCVVEFTQPVESNALFVRLPARCAAELQHQFGIRMWRKADCIFRIMTSFDTTQSDIEALAAVVNRTGPSAATVPST